MEALIILLVIVILLGALLGGKGLGGTVRKGCGFLLLLIIILIGTLIYRYSELQKTTNDEERISSAWFIVKYDCPAYAKPDISSDKTPCTHTSKPTVYFTSSRAMGFGGIWELGEKL